MALRRRPSMIHHGNIDSIESHLPPTKG